MDRRTEELLDSLEQPGAAMLYELLRRGPLTEREILERVTDTTQATANRRLAAMEHVGLIRRRAGKQRAPGRAWQVVVPKATQALLLSALSARTAIDEIEDEERRAAQKALSETADRQADLRAVE